MNIKQHASAALLALLQYDYKDLLSSGHTQYSLHIVHAYHASAIHSRVLSSTANINRPLILSTPHAPADIESRPQPAFFNR